MQLLTINNTKTLKGIDLGYSTAILHLSPHKLSGKNVCPNASAGCIASCLNTSGYGIYKNVQNARLNKTKLFFSDRTNFLALLKEDIKIHYRRSLKAGLFTAIRLNGTSDLPWETICPDLFSDYQNIIFYDYTKSFKRMINFLNGNFPLNYHLTFSRSEVNWNDCKEILSRGGNVAVVLYYKKNLKSWQGYKVIDGDKHDLRFLDYKKRIVLLSPKGKAKKDKTGFVQVPHAI